MSDGSHGKYGNGGIVFSVSYRFYKTTMSSNPTLSAILRRLQSTTYKCATATWCNESCGFHSLRHNLTWLNFLRPQFGARRTLGSLGMEADKKQSLISLRDLLNQRDWSQEVGNSKRSCGAIQFMRREYIAKQTEVY
jgi:hypothetical protein